MASEVNTCDEFCSDVVVLILVLVEDGFRDTLKSMTTSTRWVLILVLVEDGFRGQKMQSDDH